MEDNTKYLIIGILVVVLCCLSSIGGGLGWYFMSSSTDTTTDATTNTTTNTTNTAKTDTTKDSTVKPADTTKSTPQVIDCVMSEWEKCNKECGGGTQTRKITKEPSKDGKACGPTSQACNSQACPAPIKYPCTISGVTVRDPWYKKDPNDWLCYAPAGQPCCNADPNGCMADFRYYSADEMRGWITPCAP